MSKRPGGDPLIAPAGGASQLWLGNQAIARGALEARVDYVTGYPGTPASEIGDSFERVGAAAGVRFEWSVNEKVALERAFGASLAGARSLVFMKHLGLVYAGDPLSTMPYIGVVGGMVIVSAADPSCHTSPNEQDQRHIGRMLGLPTLDPSTPEEARAMTRWAFELSEAAQLPVLLRTTARVAHTRAAVAAEPFVPPRAPVGFTRDPGRFVPVPANARRLRLWLTERLARAQEAIAASPFCERRAGSGRRGVLTSGAPHPLCVELLDRWGALDRVPLLRLGAVNPLPDDVILEFIRAVDEILVVEELSPYVEDSILAMAHHYRIPVVVRGKRSGDIAWPYELGPEALAPALAAFLDLERPAAPAPAPTVELAPRTPTLCAGCPHTASFTALRLVLGDDVLIASDIGCYTLGFQEPHHAGDVLLSMGASLPLAAGLARTTGRRTVALIGDSTFFHSGMPALLDLVEQQDDVTVVVMDNQVTAMTGHQPSPTSVVDRGGQPRSRPSIAGVARALGVTRVEVVDPFDIAATVAAVRRAGADRGPAVVIAEHPCPYYRMAPAQPQLPSLPAVVDERCHTCGMQRAGLGCGLSESAGVDRLALRRRLDESWSRLFPDGPPQVAPCAAACPIGICPQAYIGSLAAGDPAAALAAVVERAALPSVCSHVCHRPCEDRCVRIGLGEAPVAVNQLKRHLTEAAGVPIVHPTCPPLAADAPSAAVVGAGPAGLAAARELRRRGWQVTVIDAAERAGGALALIPEHRLPAHVLARDVDALVALGIELRLGLRLGRDLTLGELRGDHDAVLLALGAPRVRRPQLPGADDTRAIDALGFLAEPRDPITGPVVVIGGGDVAVDAARVAARRGARVTLLAAERAGELRADPDELIAAAADGVDLQAGRGATALEPGDGALLVRTAPVLRLATTADGGVKLELGPADGLLEAARVVFATGLAPDTRGIDLRGLAIRGVGWLEADPWGRTAASDVYVAGDLALGAASVTRALASGVRAAWAMDQALRGAAAGRCAAPLDGGLEPAPAARWTGATPARPPLDNAEARAEAERCLLCSSCARCDACLRVVGCPAFGRGEQANVIDVNLCIDCGLCAVLCPNQAIGVCP